ncbi:MAG: PDZ domain-containing protein [Planctomycetota bacterium]|nr:PDZ domain-containing protein [Planctomycetota bacterium]
MNHRFAHVLLVLGILLPACASPSIEVRLASESEVVLPTQKHGNYYLVDALIDGQGPFPILLDTGAGTTVLSPHVAEQTGIRSRMDSIQIGEYEATGSIPCRIQSVEHLSRALGFQIEGIFGHQVFKGVLVTYDFPQGEVRLRSGGFTEPELREPGMMSTDKRTRPFVRASTGKVDFWLLIDTGSAGGLALGKLKRFDLQSAPKPTGGHMRINGLFIDKAARLTGQVSIGPIRLEKPVAKQAVRANLLGQRILSQFQVTFDQVQHRMLWRRPGVALEQPITMPSIVGLGLVVAPRKDRRIVRRVLAGSPAEQAGLLEGDEIVQVDGQAVLDRSSTPSGTNVGKAPKRVVLVVERGGERLTIPIESGVLVE